MFGLSQISPGWRGTITIPVGDVPYIDNPGTLSGAVIGTETTVSGISYTGDNVTLTYQWYADSEPIPGETTDAYTPSSDEDYRQLQLLVTATNGNGSHARLTSPIVTRYPAPAANGTIPDQSFDEDTGQQTLDITSYFTGNGLTYRVVDGGTIAGINGGDVEFDTSTDIDTVSITVRAENSGGFADQTFDLTIVVAAPVAVSVIPNRNYTQGTGPFTVDASGFFTGKYLTYSLSAGSGISSINSSTGVVTIPATNTNAATQITVTATNSGGSVNQSFNVTVVVAAPLVSGSIPSQSLTVGDGSGSVTVDATQAFTGESLTYTISPVGAATISSGGEITIDTSSLVVSTVFTVRATNASGFRETTFAVEVDDVAPVIVGSPGSQSYTLGDGDQTIDLTAYVAGENLTFVTAIGGAAASVSPLGVATIKTDVLRTNFSVAFDVTNTGGTVRVSLLVTVAPEAPVQISAVPALVYTKGQTATYDLSQHVSGLNLTYTRTGAQGLITSVNPTTGLLTVNTSAKAGPTSHTVTVSNPTDSVDLSISIDVRLAAPVTVGTIPAQEYDILTGVQTIATAPYFNGEDLTYTLQQGGPTATINASTGVVSINTDTVSDFQVTVQASNSTASVTQSFLVDIISPSTEIRPPSGQYVAMMAGTQPGEIFVCASPPTFLGDASSPSDNGGTGWNVAITVSDDFYSFKNTPSIPGASAADTLQTTHDPENLDLAVDNVRGLPIGEASIGETFIVGPVPVAIQSSELDGDTCTRIFLDEDLWGQTVTLTATVVNQAGVEAVSQDFTLDIAEATVDPTPINALLAANGAFLMSPDDPDTYLTHS